MSSAVNNVNINIINENLGTQNKNSNSNSKSNKKSNKSKENNSFKIILWNCNKITFKLELFKAFLKKENPDVVGLCEIKCNDAEANYYLHEDNFKIHKNDLIASLDGLQRVIFE